MKEEDRITIAAALPLFTSEGIAEDDEDDERATAMALDAMWVDLKTRSKMRPN